VSKKTLIRLPVSLSASLRTVPRRWVLLQQQVVCWGLGGGDSPDRSKGKASAADATDPAQRMANEATSENSN